MDFYVGTSGWAYAWNKTRRLDWFTSNAHLNAIELNARFYRYPSLETVENWAKKGKDLRWSIKVNRMFTHTYKFNDAAVDRWRNFQDLFAALDANIDFFLFQLPPKTTPHSAPQIEEFAKKTGFKERFALEVRNRNWFSKEWIGWASHLGLTLVSADAPDLPREIFSVHNTIYLRMHGRTAWYAYRYSNRELEETAAKIEEANPERVYVFFNNDSAMLENAQAMLSLLKGNKEKTESAQAVEV
ncbi:MAG: DUF72 domain-containing protein [Candidatus Bathyarchaeota archaeon]|nr:DUF72 domain-containing protein [Candidatus Bathyarchaeota archaeon]